MVKKLHSAVRNKEFDEAVKIESAFEKLKWVIELPHQMIKEFEKEKGGENT